MGLRRFSNLNSSLKQSKSRASKFTSPAADLLAASMHFVKLQLYFCRKPMRVGDALSPICELVWVNLLHIELVLPLSGKRVVLLAKEFLRRYTIETRALGTQGCTPPRSASNADR